MTNQPDKRFLIAVFVFGVLGAAAGFRWLSVGSIVIRGGGARVGVGGGLPRPAPQGGQPVAGSLGVNNILYYPLCVTWIGLGAAMVALSVLAFLSSNVLCLKLSAFSCLAFLLLAFGTVAATIWSGP